MIQQKMSTFTLRYRFSHYDKEEFIVYLSQNIFDNNIILKNKFIKLQILIRNEAEEITPFSEYYKLRDGEVFEYHNWDRIGVCELKQKFLNNTPLN